MEAALIIGIVLWFLSGPAIFVWAWSARWDVTTAEIPLAILSGMAGPLNLICRGLILPKWKIEQDNRSDIEHVRAMISFNVRINDIKLALGQPFEPFRNDFRYFTNPADRKVIIRCRNETKRQLQEGKIL